MREGRRAQAPSFGRGPVAVGASRLDSMLPSAVHGNPLLQTSARSSETADIVWGACKGDLSLSVQLTGPHGQPPIQAQWSKRMIRLKRAYEDPSPLDGHRVLVERLWPRGVTKERAALDLWLKEVAPSTELRRWFNHDAARWPEFQRRYREELLRRPQELAELRRLAAAGPVTLVYGSRDEQHNAALVLRGLLEDQESDAKPAR